MGAAEVSAESVETHPYAAPTSEVEAPAPELAAPRPRTVQNALATLFGRGLGQLTRLFALFVMMAHLSPESWGLLSILLSALDVGRGLTNFGLDTAAIRQMAMHPGAESGVLRFVLRAKTGLAAVGMLGLGYYAYRVFGGFSSPAPILLLPLALFPLGWTASMTARFQARHAMHWLIPVQASVGGVYLVVVYLAARAGFQLTGFIALVVVVEFVTCAITAIVGRRAWADAPAAAEPMPVSSWRTVFWEGLPLGLLDIVVILYMRLGMFLVKSKGGGDIEAGHLYAAIKMNEYTIAFAGALAASALPVFSRLARDGKILEIRRMFLKYSAACLGLSVSAATFLTLFGGRLLSLKNPANAAAAAPLAILTWAGVAMFQNNLSASVLYAFGRYRRVTGWAFVSLSLYYLIGSQLVPLYRASGAAATMICTEWTAALVYLGSVLWLLRKPRGTEASLKTNQAA